MRCTSKHFPAQKLLTSLTNQTTTHIASFHLQPRHFHTVSSKSHPNFNSCFFFFFFSLCSSKMQQRSSSSSSRFSGDEHRAIVNIGAEQQQQHTKRRRSADDDLLDGGLPLYHPRTAAAVRWEFSGRSSRSPAEKWIHAIPALVLLCLFTLWWFSFPGTTRNLNVTSIVPSISYSMRFSFVFSIILFLLVLKILNADLWSECIRSMIKWN